MFFNKQSLQSQEVTHQGDTNAMSIYGIAIITLIEFAVDCFTFQKWYVDDGYDLGFLDNLKNFITEWKYMVLLTRSHIITKKQVFGKAQQVFVYDEVEIVDCCRTLDSVIGSDRAQKKL